MRIWPDSSVYDAAAMKAACALECKDESRALQSAKEECDINTIVKRFGITGQLPQNVRMPEYGDFPEGFDYQDAMNAIVSADRSFNSMPADVRSRFGNDPYEFVKFCYDERNLPELIKLGLVVDKTPTPPPPVPPA